MFRPLAPILVLVIANICLFSFSAVGAYVPGGDIVVTPKGPNSGSSSTTYTGLRAAVDVSLGSGTMSNQLGTIASRSVNSAALGAHLGFKSRFIEPFIMGEYEYAQQATAAVQVSNTNTSGSGYVAGPGLAIDIGPFVLSATYLMFGSFSMTQSIAGGSPPVYSDPLGFRFGLDYELSPKIILTLFYRAVEYKSLEQAGTVSDISLNRFTYNRAGLGLGWGF